MAEDDDLLRELELGGKKKKKKKKITLDSVAAEAAALAGNVEPPQTGENPPTEPPEEHLTTGASVSATAEGGDDADELQLPEKKRKKKKVLPEVFPQPAVLPAAEQAKVAEPVQLELLEREAPSVLDDFQLPKKKKKRRPNITFEGFDTILALEIDGEEGGEGVENEEYIEPTDNSPWADSDRDYTYEELLERVFNIMRQKNPNMVGGQKKKLVMKPPQVVRVGAKKTSFVNFTDICKLLHRQPKHLLAFLLAELGTSGSIDGTNQLIIKGKFQQKQIEIVLRRYIKEYVTCHTCRSPDTILQKETRLFFLQCETCSSRCSVQSIKSGFQAVTGHRAQLRSKQQ